MELNTALYNNRAAAHLSLGNYITPLMCITYDHIFPLNFTEYQVLTRMLLFRTGNYRSCINDCTAAREIDSKNVKTYFRASKALCALDLFAEAIKWCDEGLEIEPDNAPLIKVWNTFMNHLSLSYSTQRTRDSYRKPSCDTMENCRLVEYRN